MQRARFRSTGIGVRRVSKARIWAWAVLAGQVALTAFFPFALVLTFYGLIANVGVLIGLYLGTQRPPPDRRMLPGSVEIDGDSIQLLADVGPRLIPRAALRGGWIDSFHDDHRVVLRHENGDHIWIRCDDREQAHALLRAAGFAPEQHTFEARLVSVAAAELTQPQRVALALGAIYGVPTFVGVAAAAFAGDHVLRAVIALSVFVLSLLTLAIVHYCTLRTALVGTDGVTVKSLSGRRFVPYTDVSRVRLDDRGVWLERHAGADVLLPPCPRMRKKPLVMGAPPAADELVLFERIHEAMAAGGRAGEADARFGALDRRGRTIDDWKRDLRALVQRAGAGYRQVSLEPDELAQLLESASAPPERRIAAAIALSATGDEATRARLRFAVDACANEELRLVLEHAAEGEVAEDELGRAVQVRG